MIETTTSKRRGSLPDPTPEVKAMQALGRKKALDRRRAHQSLGPRAKIEAIASTIPEIRRPLYLSAMFGESSAMQAIKAKCQECTGYEDTFSRVRDCAILRCTLNPFRPYQESTDET